MALSLSFPRFFRVVTHYTEILRKVQRFGGIICYLDFLYSKCLFNIRLFVKNKLYTIIIAVFNRNLNIIIFCQFKFVWWTVIIDWLIKRIKKPIILFQKVGVGAWSSVETTCFPSFNWTSIVMLEYLECNVCPSTSISNPVIFGK